MTEKAGQAPIANPLLTLIDLGHRARAAAEIEELAFLVVNDTLALHPYRQAVLWLDDHGVRSVSGILQPDCHAPFNQWMNRVCRELHAANAAPGSSPRRVSPDDLSAELATEWAEWLPAEAVWLPFAGAAGRAGGGLLLAGEHRCPDTALSLLVEWMDIWRHAWLARFRPSPWSPKRAYRQFRTWLARDSGAKWWQRRRIRIALATLLVLCFPVRLTVLASGELVSANPAVIRAPLDGVIGQFHVQPNQVVKAGEVLFSFDEAPIASRLEVARQALATAEAEYRQFAQIALTDPKSKGQLAVLLGKIAEKRAEAEFLASQFERAKVLAPHDGIALFDDPSEWIGRPVQTGERVMRVADADDVEIEAWLPIGDAIPLPERARVSLYLASSPFSSIAGQVRYIGHDALPRLDGSYAYRVRATLESSPGQRVGLKGTAKLEADWVTFSYWVLRRPLASIRQFLAF